ncbi:DUF4175 family protein [Muriicola marianensis]|uniref:ATPase n=1 Tax=Muriicola marianensis TaxID=1324801 RepID=A0ABQ1QYF3_9FLAO|nr:DUF4175 family protein [Muriicola marianensis]GGD50120.1 ATPase [Muriicola marianensis]
MESYNGILDKLSGFITKYYRTRMVKGAFLFLALGLLFWLLLLSLEYFLWMGTTGRMVLFLMAIGGTLFLLVNYLGIPLMYLLRVRKGLSLKEAARIIGDHFPEVGDRLVNLLDLATDPEKSELLLASIDQRSQALSPIPFQQAIDIRKSLTYARYALIPLLALAGIWIAGKVGEYKESLDRVVHYDMAYEKPAPFHFLVLNSSLKTISKQDYTLRVGTEGDIKPEYASIVVDGKERMMLEEDGQFVYTFTAPEGSQEFYLTANEVRSRHYTLETIVPPVIEEFITVLNYPGYTGKPKDTILGTGNAVVPEGTEVNWIIRGENTGNVSQVTEDSVQSFIRSGDIFKLERTLDSDFSYEITTSNEELRDYERLEYKISVIRDAPPSILVTEVRDSILNALTYEGRAGDDYGLVRLDMVYYEENREDLAKKVQLDYPGDREYFFAYDFPTGLDLQSGKTYNFYFQVTDNDQRRGGKVSKSQVFSSVIPDPAQLEEQRLEEQKNTLEQWNKNLEEFGKQEEELKELEQNQKEKNVLDYNDQKAIKDFLKAQQKQEALMEKFSRKVQETLDDSRDETTVDKLLKERLQRQESEARKNEKLLEELQKLADKIDREELAKRLEEIGKRQQNNKRNLSQLLELTKQYYVTEKASKLSEDLRKMSEKQEELADSEKKGSEATQEQEGIKDQFDQLTEELEELRNSNQELKKPLPIDTSEDLQEKVQKDMQNAIEQLRGSEDSQEGIKDSQEESKKSQRSAAQKMKRMSEALQQSAMSGGAEGMAEDAEMLRQILENLIVFSLKQEDILDKLTQEEGGRNYSVSVVREEQQLRGLFEHVDDSLFALSLRQAEISEFVNEQITEVYYNIDSSLENLSEGQAYRAGAHQQAVLTAANSLADFLADVLSNMQQSLAQGQGSGKPQDGFQLPDIIKGQEELQGSMEQLGKDKTGVKGEEGKGQSDGQQGENTNGKEGSSGEGQIEEQELEALYEIYKQQQMIREKLEEQLEDMIRNEDRELARRLARQMEDFERDLIENGITERTMDKVNRIRQQLLRLENAAMEQGEDEERESDKALNRYDRPVIRKREAIMQDKGIIELLQRQALPLQEFYNEALKRYFREDD